MRPDPADAAVAQSEKNVMTHLTFEPMIPASLWLLLAVVAAVLLVWYGRSQPGHMGRVSWVGIMALMFGGIAAVLAVLLNPTWIHPIRPPAGKPLLTVLVDASASMSVKDAAGGASRYEAACLAAEKLSRDLAAQFDVRVRSFSTSLEAADNTALSGRQPSGELTDVAAAVAGSVERDRPAGQAMLLLSDGIHNASPAAREVLTAVRSARAAGVPIYTCTLGRADTPDLYDLSAEIRNSQQLAYVGQKLPVHVRIRQRAGIDGPVEVTLLEEGKPVDVQQVMVPSKGIAEAKFTVSQEYPGIYRYEARVETKPGELIEANNTALLLVQVVSEPIRVLLLEGKPYWDNKFLMRTLASDPVIGLDSIVRMTETRYLRRSLGASTLSGSPADMATTAPAGPTGRPEWWKVVSDPGEVLARPEALKDYQILVLGRNTEVFLSETAVNNIRHWMSRQGGCLVCYRGSPAVQAIERLAQVLPVQWSEAAESRFRIQLTDEGQSLQWLSDLDDHISGRVLSQLPTLATTAQVDHSRAMSAVLATSVSATGQVWPVLSYRNYGTGKVVVVEGAGMWRWAFLPPHNAEYDAVYASLWQSMIRWLVSGAALRPGQKMDLRCEKVVFESSESASALLLLDEEAVGKGPPAVELLFVGQQNPIGIYNPSAAGQDPGVYRVVFGTDPLPAGQYEARVVGTGPMGPSARFDVQPTVREQLELTARPDLMARIAEDSGGAVMESVSGRDIAGFYNAYVHKTQPERVRRLPAWDRWYVMIAVLGLWTSAWALRRAKGLI